MAFTRTGGSWIHEYAALSTDTKYTKATHPNIDVPNGSACIEIDTDDIYLYDKDNDQWCLFSSGGGGGGSGGTTNYNQLSNKPKINNVELSGNKTLSDIGAIAAPSSPATGAFLVWNGTAWVAQTLATWQGGNY